MFVSTTKLDSINIAFLNMHKLISTTAPMTNDRIAKVEQKIKQYMTLFLKESYKKVKINRATKRDREGDKEMEREKTRYRETDRPTHKQIELTLMFIFFNAI